MSHFNVAVLTRPDGASVDELLEPYYEGITVAPYVCRTKAQIIDEQKAHLKQILDTPAYQEWVADPTAYKNKTPKAAVHAEFLETVPDLLKLSDEELYLRAIDGYDPDELNSDGDILSTYNPQSKWDWYSIGGRWANSLYLKPDVVPNGGAAVDSAIAANIDFARMQDLENPMPSYEEAKANYLLGPAAFEDRYPTEEIYIQRHIKFHTYAVITPNGVWHSPGEMGWFGLSSEKADEFAQWVDDYWDRFIQPAIDCDGIITIVDCHI